MGDRVGVMRVEKVRKGRFYLWDDKPWDPLEEYCLGEVRKAGDGYFRFYPNDGIELTCHHLRHIAKMVGELNS